MSREYDCRESEDNFGAPPVPSPPDGREEEGPTLTERLRAHSPNSYPCGGLAKDAHEAADEIERLQRLVAESECTYCSLPRGRCDCFDEIRRVARIDDRAFRCVEADRIAAKHTASRPLGAAPQASRAIRAEWVDGGLVIGCDHGIPKAINVNGEHFVASPSGESDERREQRRALQTRSESWIAFDIYGPRRRSDRRVSDLGRAARSPAPEEGP